MPSEFTRSPEIDAYNDTLSIFRHAPGKHMWFIHLPDCRSIGADFKRYGDFVPMASFTSPEGEERMVYTCSARGITVLTYDTFDGTVVGIRAMELEQLNKLCEHLS